MSWLYSQALVEAYSVATCSDGVQSALSSSIPTPQAYLSPDKMTGFSRLSRFGMTFGPLTDDRGKALLTWFLAGFHVRTSAVQEKEQASTGIGQGSGQKWLGLLARHDRDMCLWKTAQCSLLEDSELFSETWPRWGSMLNGDVYQQQTVALRTKEIESGLWATPTTMDKLPPKSPGALQREATVARPGRRKPANLRDQVSNMQNWPTPQASDNRDRGNLSSVSVKNRIQKGKQIMLSMSVSTENGRLNPIFVEWLMGWPLGWTDLQPLAMDRFQEWQQQHSISYKGERHETE